MEEKSYHYLVLFTGLLLCLLHSGGVSSCDNISQIDFAEITYEPEGLAPHSDGTVARIECGVFYQILPTTFEITTCTNGSWTGRLPRCRHVPRYCQRNEALVQIYGQDCQTQCRNLPNGGCPGNKRCHCNGVCGWSCISIYEDNFCPEVADQAGLLVTYDPPERRFNGFADLSCGEGYIYHSGSSRLLCMSNRQWGGGNNFVCIPNVTSGVSSSCDNIYQIDFAEITYEPEGLAPHSDGTVARIECGVFYQILPTTFERTTCTNGSWTGPLPQCRHVPRYCQRNEALVQIYGRDCQTQCRNRLNGACPENKQCHCDGVCGWSCISIYEDDFCPEVADEAGLLVTYDPPERRFNGYANFSCGEGYIYHSGSSRLLCMSNRQWGGGNDFVCIPNDNQNPVVTCPADFTSDTLTVSFTVDVTDNADPAPALTYNPLGPGSIFPLGPTTVSVTATDSSSNQDSCTFTVTVTVPTESICEDPGVPVNGFMTNAKQVYHLGDVVYYHCNEGNTMDGSILNSCTESGEWRHPVPVCGGPCTVPPNPRDGWWQNSNDYPHRTSVPHNTRLWLTCHWRFDERRSSVKCNDGVWSDSDQVHRLCRGTPCEVRWSSDVALNITYDPPISDEDRLNHRIQHDTRVHYDCAWGYRLQGVTERRCEQGIYRPNNNIPRCELVPCPAEDVSHGRLTYTTPDGVNKHDHPLHGDTRLLQCGSGYRSRNFSRSRCDNGLWVEGSHDIRCYPKPCDPIPDTMGLVDYTRTAQANGKYSHGTEVTVNCDSGYLPAYGNGTAVCNASQWLTFIPTCTQSSCNAPDLPDHMIASQPQPQFPHGTLLDVSCEYGFQLSRNQEQLRCNRGGWSPPLTATCQRVPCGRPVRASYSTIEILPGVQGYVHGTRVRYSCSEGWEIEGTAERECDNGQWTGSTPACRVAAPPRCMLPDRTRGHRYSIIGFIENVFDEGLPIGERVSISVSCNQGYTAQPSVQTECLERGVWSVAVPICVRMERLCSKPRYISHVVQYVNGLETNRLDTYPHDELPEGTFLVSRCSLPGQYVLRGSANRTCSDSSWTGEEPSCDEADTRIVFQNNQPLDVRSTGTIVIHPRSQLNIYCYLPSYGIARFEAENGPYAFYRGHGLSTMVMSLYPPRTSQSGRFTCRSDDNTLSHTVYVQFAEIYCDSPTAPTNGDIRDYETGWKYERYYMGKEITFACNDGYILDGERRITCVLGEWSHPVPRCQRHSKSQ